MRRAHAAVLVSIDEFQRELIVEGTREGLDAARARGRSGGRKPKLIASQITHARQLVRGRQAHRRRRRRSIRRQPSDHLSGST